MGQEPKLSGKQQSKFRRTPKTRLDPTVIPRVAVARTFLTEASANTMRKRWAKEITETGEAKTCKSGEGDTDGRKGREEAVDEVIERVRRSGSSIQALVH